ncbi:MAG: nucleotidyltransferase family protein [Gemmataceae bacterium]|nr:nucleotidyltransferase family protein [Gemmataceae bacterium]
MIDIPALILVGGLGTRLRSVLPDRPKALAPVAGRPFLSYLFDQLQAAGLRRAVLCTGYQAHQVEATFGPRYGALVLTYSREEAPLGTGGALRLALPKLDAEEALVLNGDSYVDYPLAEFHAWHREHGFAGSLLLTWTEDTARFGTVEVDAAGRIRAFREKQGLARPGWINAGIYLLARRLLEALPAGRPVSLEREAFPAWLAGGLGGPVRRAAFLDVGTPESLAQAEAFLAKARVAR